MWNAVRRLGDAATWRRGDVECEAKTRGRTGRGRTKKKKSQTSAGVVALLESYVFGIPTFRRSHWPAARQWQFAVLPQCTLYAVAALRFYQQVTFNQGLSIIRNASHAWTFSNNRKTPWRHAPYKYDVIFYRRPSVVYYHVILLLFWVNYGYILICSSSIWWFKYPLFKSPRTAFSS